MQYTTNKNLYKWQTTDRKVDTITEMASNAQKIDDELTLIDTEISGLKTQDTSLDTKITTVDTDAKTRDTEIESRLNTTINTNDTASKQRDNDLDQRIDTIVAQSGTDNTEIVDARLGFPVLRDKLEDVDAQLADIAKKPDDFSGANDNERFSALFTSGNSILLRKNHVYELTDALFVPDNTVIYCNNATLNFRLDGMKKAFVLGSNVRMIGNLNINVYSTNSSGSGEWQCPLLIGNYNNGVGEKNIKIDSVRLFSERSGGNALMITGDSHNIEIGNIEIPDNTTIGCPVMIHWGGAGLDPLVTTHVHNVKINNIKIMKNTNNSTSGVFISASHNIKIGNIEVEEIGGDVLSIYAGDYGYEYADESVKPLACKNIVIDNVTCKNAHKNGLIVNLKPLLLDVDYYTSNFEIKRVKVIGDGTSNVKYGINAFNCKSGLIELIEVSGFDYGGLVQSGVKGLKINKMISYNNRNTGFYIGHATDSPEDITIDDLISYNNGVNAAINNMKSGLFVAQAKRVKVKNSKFGILGELYQMYGVRLDTTAIDTELESNHVRGVISGGTAYSLASSTTYEVVKKFINNSAESGITLKGGMSPTVAFVTPNGNKVCYGTAVPTSGTWKRGDIVINTAFSSASGSPTQWVCSADGTPGTWVASAVTV